MSRAIRLSRWGRSAYETDAEIRLEVEALSAWVEVQSEQADAEIVVVHSKVPFGAEQHTGAPSLQMLVTTTSGTDHIDLDYFRGENIPVCRLPEARRDAVVDMTVQMLIWGLRGVGVMQSASRQGKWIRSGLPELASVGLNGSRIGVVGLGVIGRQVCTVLQAFGVELWGADPRGVPEGIRPVNIPEMLGHCDAVTLHCTLDRASRNLLSPAVLDVAHPDLVIVNTARGSILAVDYAIEMVRNRQLGGLAVDVFPAEPWPDMAVTNDLDTVMCLPHAAGYHRGLSAMVRDGLCSAVSAFVNGHRLPHQM